MEMQPNLEDANDPSLTEEASTADSANPLTAREEGEVKARLLLQQHGERAYHVVLDACGALAKAGDQHGAAALIEVILAIRRLAPRP